MSTSHLLNIFRSIIVFSIIALFVGCGGGGGGGTASSESANTISGTVSGAILSGVTMTLSGTSSGTVTTDSSGNYTFIGLANGSYTVTPSLKGYTFNSVSEAVKVNGANITSINFTATANTNPTYSISGTVSGSILEGVTVTLSGSGSGTVATDASGNYSFTGQVNGSYTVTPSLAGYTFTPASMKITLNGANSASNNFTATVNPAPTYSIAGTVTLSGSGALAGVTMTLKGTHTTATTTDASGNYTFTGLANGSYTVSPSLAGYTFNPASTSVTINGANATSYNFTATQTPTSTPTYSISGTVTLSGGGALPGVTVTLSGAGSGTATTDSSGNYIFSNLANGSYTLTPRLSGYTFSQTSSTKIVSGASIPGVNFVANYGSPNHISGVAAAGAPIVGTVTIKDSQGNVKTVQIAANGTYTIDVTGMTPPFALMAVGKVGDTSYTLYSAATSADIGGNINITPFTDLIIDGIAGQIAANYYDSGSFSTLTPAQLNASEAALQSKLLPILTAMGLSSSIDLLRTSFNTNLTGLDAVIDVVQVAVDPTTAIATITNIINQQTITENIATQTYTGSFTADPNIAQGVSDIQAIDNQLNTLTGLFATSLPSPTNPQLLALFDTTFLNDGQDLNEFLSDITSGSQALGATFSGKIDSIDPVAGTAVVEIIADTTDGQKEPFQGPWNFIKNNGIWLIQGDQWIAWVSIFPEADYSEATSFINTGFNLNVTQLSTSNIAYVIYTGPGLPQAGVTVTNQELNGIPYNPGDAVISAIPDNSVYTFKVYDASNNLLATYTQTCPKRPLMMTELSAASFPTFTAQTLSALGAFTGGTLQVAWTLPTGLFSYKVGLTLFDSTGSNSAEVEQHVGGNVLNTMLTLQPITSTGTQFTPVGNYWFIEAQDSYKRNFITKNY